MARLIILEGTRATGKSTVTHRLRQNIEGSTLINFTGFKEDGEYGLSKVSNYYDNWINFFSSLSLDYTVICDRLFFSELVYSSLYKSYNFSGKYNQLLNNLITQKHEILLYFLTIEESDIPNRVDRDKINLFNKIEDSVQNLNIQRIEYERLMRSLNINNIRYNLINTSTKSQEETYDLILSDYENLRRK